MFTVQQIDFWFLSQWTKQGFYLKFLYVTFLLPFMCSVLRAPAGRGPFQLSRWAQQPRPTASADLPGSAKHNHPQCSHRGLCPLLWLILLPSADCCSEITTFPTDSRRNCQHFQTQSHLLHSHKPALLNSHFL